MMLLRHNVCEQFWCASESSLYHTQIFFIFLRLVSQPTTSLIKQKITKQLHKNKM